MENSIEKYDRIEIQERPAVAEDAPRVATYTINKRTGGYNIRVTGPKAGLFAGQEVPVTRKDGTERMEKLTRLVWSGIDDMDFPGHKATFMPVAIYEIEQRPREPEPPPKFR